MFPGVLTTAVFGSEIALEDAAKIDGWLSGDALLFSER